jgi:hypothetical protein
VKLCERVSGGGTACHKEGPFFVFLMRASRE